jgi:hypothetical protein
VLLRIVILVAVVTAVPAVLWTITVFMRTYVAQPVIPGVRPLAVATAASATADVTSTASTPAAANSSLTTLATSDADTRSDRPRDISAASGNPPGVAPTVVAYAPTAAPMTVQPGLPPDKILVQTSPAPAPDASANPGTATSAQPVDPPAPAAEADDLPAPDPLTGPVPLPPRRPAVFALAETGIPLPRARPAIAPEPAPAEEPFAGYDPGMTHY